jgi:hypothetical protein
VALRVRSLLCDGPGCASISWRWVYHSCLDAFPDDTYLCLEDEADTLKKQYAPSEPATPLTTVDDEVSAYDCA